MSETVKWAEGCEGCVTATDVGMPEYEPYIVHVHPACPVHGVDQPAPAGDDELRESERYFRSRRKFAHHDYEREQAARLMAEYDERGRLVRWWRERFYQLGRERDAARAEVQRLQFVVERQRGELAKLRARDEKATTVVQAWTALAPKYPGFEGDGDLQVALDELARAHEEAQ